MVINLMFSLQPGRQFSFRKPLRYAFLVLWFLVGAILPCTSTADTRALTSAGPYFYGDQQSQTFPSEQGFVDWYEQLYKTYYASQLCSLTKSVTGDWVDNYR